MMGGNDHEGKILWIGGTSSLTRTFVGSQLIDPSRLVLVGLEPLPPMWVPASSQYVRCDLTTVTDNQARTLIQQFANDVSSIVIGVRPLLFAPYTSETMAMLLLQGVEKLLRIAAQILLPSTLKMVLHISSVAAMDHLRAQIFLSESEPYPPIAEYHASYDKFKRHSEESISAIFESSGVAVCHLRLSAIFSDDATCIQCSALKLQSRVGCFLPIPIDCNSSFNVSRAIHAMLRQVTEDATKIQPTYYYTRPISLKRPVPYGYYLKEYRKAYHLNDFNSIWIPFWVITMVVALVHWLAWWNHFFQIPYLDAIDYLLQVSSHEHSFDCSRIAQDFSCLEQDEESILECFVRRKQILEIGDRQSNCNSHQKLE